MRKELADMKDMKTKESDPLHDENDKNSYAEFAAPFSVQAYEVTKRVFQQLWRTPSYIWAKAVLCGAAGLFIGFSFYNAPLSLQGLQNQMFSIFLLFTIFGQLVQQIMPHFVTQRYVVADQILASSSLSLQISV